MKVISQGTVSPSQPYFHLAYMAAAQKFQAPGIFLLALAVVIIGEVWLLKTPGKIPTRSYKRSKFDSAYSDVTKRVCQTLLLFVGSIAFLLCFLFGTYYYLYSRV